jgi:hypothetical protein
LFSSQIDHLLDSLTARPDTPIIPVHCVAGHGRVVYVLFGSPVPVGSNAAEVRRALSDLAYRNLLQSGVQHVAAV